MTRISRRDFARAAAGAIAGTALLGKARADDKPLPLPTPPPPPSPPPQPTAAAQEESEARVALIVARHGARLTAADRTELLRLSSKLQGHLDKLRAFPLDWDDQPAHIFRASRRRPK